MNLKDMLAKMSQLSEATEKTKTGVKHTAEPGGYGRKDDEDEEGKKVKSDAPKKGRGRPKKDADASGEVKKYDFSAFGVKHGKDVKLPAHDKKKTTKHSLKDWIETIDQNMLAEAEQIEIKPASQTKTQVIQQGNKTLGTVNNPQLAQQIKQSIGKGEMSLNPDGQEMEEGLGDMARKVGGAVNKVVDRVSGKTARDAEDARIQKRLASREPPSLASQLSGFSRPNGDKTGLKDPQEYDRGQEYDRISSHKGRYGESVDEAGEASYSAKKAAAGKDIGQPGKNFAKIAKSSGGGEKGKRIAGAILAKLRGLKEGDMPSHDGDMGAGLGAGRNQGTFESKKPDANKNNIPDYAEDGKGKNDLKKKKKVKEGLSQNLQSARLAGKSHGLKGHSHCGKNYEDMEEARMYHEGYKEGLDECYGMGSVLETEMPATVPGMASQADHEMDEGNAFTNALNRTPTGGKFSIGGRTFTDRSSIEETGSMFESWDNELSNLLNEYTEIQEGMTVSISKGNQNQPDSVTVSAQDGEADQLLAAIKQAGLGLFGGDEARGMNGQQTAPDPMTVDVDGQEGEADIDVVDDHEGMMDLIRKVTGGAGQPNVVAIGGEEGSDDNGDYEDEQSSDEHDSEGHDHEDDEATCESCGGVHEGNCAPEGDKEMVDEVESEDQQEFEVSEDNAPDSGAAETTADENAEAAEDQALATVDAGQDKEEGEEDAVQESYANGDDDKFETDINFMTKVISGGLNKQKSTGQTTVPVVATQASRLGNPMQESTNLLHDWKSLAGIK
jgi:hypothetical protein